MSMNEHKLIAQASHKCAYGPGGRTCACCLPMLKLHKLNRFVRRKLKQELHKELKNIDI